MDQNLELVQILELVSDMSALESSSGTSVRLCLDLDKLQTTPFFADAAVMRYIVPASERMSTSPYFRPWAMLRPVVRRIPA
jgi:hypothetical protein